MEAIFTVMIIFTVKFQSTVEPHNDDLGTMEITLLCQVSCYIRVKKYKELGPANLHCYKRVLVISDLFITRLHCI